MEKTRDLGDGLILRPARMDDLEALVEIHSRIFAENKAHFDEAIGWWTRDLVSGKHPDFKIEDFILVEDTRLKKIASTMCILNHTWSYEGVEFRVGRPECVATEDEYRGRGLVRIQMQAIHGLSHERNQLVQAITGIPYFYRQFGYDQGAVDMEAGWNIMECHVPFLKPDQPEPFPIRLATETDLPLIKSMYAQNCARSAIAGVFSDGHLLYQFHVSPQNCERELMAIIEQPDHQAVGVIFHSNEFWQGSMPVTCLEILPGIPWMEPCQSALRYLWNEGKRVAVRSGTEFKNIALWLGREHPAYDALPDRLTVRHKPYGMYVRVPDLPAFLMHIRPALEARLAISPAAGYTGSLEINRYTQLLKLEFSNGKITEVSQTKKVNADAPAAFPEHTILKLIFGAKSLQELDDAYPDVYIRPQSDAKVLLNALFPQKQSNILMMG
jgi:hypothetical protein